MQFNNAQADIITVYLNANETSLLEYYFNEQFKLKNENTNKAFREYVEWFKLISAELLLIIQNINKKQLDLGLKTNWQDSDDVKIYLYNQDSNLSKIITKIDQHPFLLYFQKYYSINFTNLTIEYKDIKPYVAINEQPKSTLNTQLFNLKALTHQALENMAEKEIGRKLTEKKGNFIIP